MADLEEFRKQWEKELSHSNRRKSSLQPGTSSSSDATTTKHGHGLDVEPDEESSLQGVLIDSLVDNDSNSTENYQPFVIVDNLLKDGCTSNNKLCKTPENARLSVPPSNSYFCDTISNSVTKERNHATEGKRRGKSPPQTYSKLHAEKKRRLAKGGEERLLDKLISDLDEITEIPFFDIDLPRELALKIFQHLEMKDLCNCCQVSRAWRNLAEDELLWHRICVELGEHALVSEGGNWKSHAQFCVTRVRTLTTNWKSRVGKLEQFQYIKGGILCHVSSHQDRLVAGYTNGQVKMWELRSGAECVFQPSCTSLSIDEGQEEGTLPNLLVYTDTSEGLTAAAYSQGIVDIWQNEGVLTSPVYTINCPQSVTTASLAPNQPLILTAYGSYIRADFSPGQSDFSQLQILDLNAQVKHMALLCCPNSNHSIQYKAAICAGNVVWLHQPGQSQEAMTELHNMIDAPITALDVDEGRSQLAIGVSVYGGPLHSCKVKLYCLNSGRTVTTLKGHTYFISCINVAQSPPHCLITGCGDRKVRVYDVRCPSPALTLARHTQTVTQVQMDDWKLVSGGEDGLTCVWDQRMALKLWDWHNRHPVRYSQFHDNRLIVANIPVEKFPQKDDFESVLHKRYRGSIQMYDFLSDQSTQGVPENCLSSYDTAEGYDYNIRLTMPYDNV